MALRANFGHSSYDRCPAAIFSAIALVPTVIFWLYSAIRALAESASPQRDLHAVRSRKL